MVVRLMTWWLFLAVCGGLVCVVMMAVLATAAIIVPFAIHPALVLVSIPTMAFALIVGWGGIVATHEWWEHMEIRDGWEYRRCMEQHPGWDHADRFCLIHSEPD